MRQGVLFSSLGTGIVLFTMAVGFYTDTGMAEFRPRELSAKGGAAISAYVNPVRLVKSLPTEPTLDQVQVVASHWATLTHDGVLTTLTAETHMDTSMETAKSQILVARRTLLIRIKDVLLGAKGDQVGDLYLDALWVNQAARRADLLSLTESVSEDVNLLQQLARSGAELSPTQLERLRSVVSRFETRKAVADLTRSLIAASAIDGRDEDVQILIRSIQEFEENGLDEAGYDRVLHHAEALPGVSLGQVNILRGIAKNIERLQRCAAAALSDSTLKKLRSVLSEENVSVRNAEANRGTRIGAQLHTLQGRPSEFPTDRPISLARRHEVYGGPIDVRQRLRQVHDRSGAFQGR